MSEPVKINLECHLWNKADLTAQDLKSGLVDIRQYVDETHLIRNLKRCPQCGQLYFYQFLEEVDFAGGEDPQYRIWIPVETLDRGDFLSTLSETELMQMPRLAQNWPSDKKGPLPIQKIG